MLVNRLCPKNEMTHEKEVKCDSCNITYKKYSSLLRHNDQIHSDNPTFQCSQCSKRCGGKNELEKHMKTHDTESFFKSVCSFCEKKYKSEDSLNNHIKRSHTKEKIHKCSSCPKKFPYESELKYHQASHETKPLEEYLDCDECPKKLKNKDTLNIHKLRHSGIKPYRCDFCEKKFRQSAHKRTHQKNVHMASGDKPFKCNQCPRLFGDSGHRNKHQKYHAKQSVQCSVCEVFFKNIEIHSKNVHAEKQRNISCRTCADMFVSLYDRKQHEKTHVQEKELQCPSCNYKTSLSTNLKIHTRVHTQEKPFKCKQCDFSSATGGTMIGHVQRIHTKIESVTCQICLKEIKQYTYKRHMSEHLNEPKFKCYTCGKMFKRLSHKYLHEATHENPISPSATRVRIKKKVQCPVCEKVFKGSLNLKSHKLSVHTTEKPHKCAICPKLFPTENERNMHARIHTEQILHCTICNKQCPNRPSLVRHNRYVHKTVTFDCQICDQRFSSAGGFKSHNLQHKENQNDKFACDLCGDQFTSKSYMKMHKDAQHKQITHECPKCGFKLKYKIQLKLHLETHNENGNKHVECDLCDDKFSTRAYMKLHKKSRHMGVTHDCIHCNVKFLWKVSLISHIKANHEKEIK